MRIKILLSEVKPVARPKIQIKPEDKIDSIKKHNIDILENELVDQSYVDAAMEAVPVFSEIQIKRKLASGTQGSVFQLTDDRLVKIYTGSYLGGGVQREDERYEKLKQKIFSSSGTKRDLPVYDHGIETYVHETHVKDWRTGLTNVTKTNVQFGWVVMGKVLPLDQYILIKNNMDHSEAQQAVRAYENLYIALSSFATNYLRQTALYYINPTSVNDIMTNKDFIQDILQSNGYNQVKIHIGEKFATEFITEILEMYIDSGNNFKVFKDLHSGNVGVRNEVDPTPVIFDV